MRAPLAGLQFVTVPRYWTGAFPRADFAYVPWGEDGPNREGKMMRFRKLAVSRRARAALLDARLFGPGIFFAFRSVAIPEPGVVVLDEGLDPIPPMYTAEEMAILRSEEKRQFAKAKGDGK